MGLTTLLTMENKFLQLEVLIDLKKFMCLQNGRGGRCKCRDKNHLQRQWLWPSSCGGTKITLLGFISASDCACVLRVVCVWLSLLVIEYTIYYINHSRQSEALKYVIGAAGSSAWNFERLSVEIHHGLGCDLKHHGHSEVSLIAFFLFQFLPANCSSIKARSRIIVLAKIAYRPNDQVVAFGYRCSACYALAGVCRSSPLQLECRSWLPSCQLRSQSIHSQFCSMQDIQLLSTKLTSQAHKCKSPCSWSPDFCVDLRILIISSCSLSDWIKYFHAWQVHWIQSCILPTDLQMLLLWLPLLFSSWLTTGVRVLSISMLISTSLNIPQCSVVMHLYSVSPRQHWLHLPLQNRCSNFPHQLSCHL